MSELVSTRGELSTIAQITVKGWGLGLLSLLGIPEKVGR